jgi:hypothetical protein
MWHLFQMTIFLTVIFTDIEYHWSTGMYVAPAVAFVITFLATVLVGKLVEGLHRLLRKVGTQKGLH